MPIQSIKKLKQKDAEKNKRRQQKTQKQSDGTTHGNYPLHKYTHEKKILQGKITICRNCQKETTHINENKQCENCTKMNTCKNCGQLTQKKDDDLCQTCQQVEMDD